MDFTVEVPYTPDPGAQIFRDDAGDVWVRVEAPGHPWHTRAFPSALITRVGDRPASELSDAELLAAMVSMDQAITVEQRFETADGEEIRRSDRVTEL